MFTGFCFGRASRSSIASSSRARLEALRPTRFDGGVSAAKVHLLPGGPSAHLYAARTPSLWWAAYVGAATEVHAPGVGTVPVPADEHRYVFHDIASRKYWGRWDAAAREIRYPDARRRGDDDDDAIPMGFGVGHPSFKAAFPVSESWGS